VREESWNKAFRVRPGGGFGVFWREVGSWNPDTMASMFAESRCSSVERDGVCLGVNYLCIRSRPMIEEGGIGTSLSPKSSPTLLCRIAPDETLVTMRPEPEDGG